MMLWHVVIVDALFSLLSSHVNMQNCPTEAEPLFQSSGPRDSQDHQHDSQWRQHLLTPGFCGFRAVQAVGDLVTQSRHDLNELLKNRMRTRKYTFLTGALNKNNNITAINKSDIIAYIVVNLCK